MAGKKISRTVVALMMVFLLAAGCAACSGGDTENPEGLLLNLSFDEGAGNQVSSVAGTVEPAEVNYLFTNSAYMENRDPEWRMEGVQGGCLLFDGNSNYISYDPEQLLVEGEALTVSVWVAPRGLRVGRSQRRQRHGEPDRHSAFVRQSTENHRFG